MENIDVGAFRHVRSHACNACALGRSGLFCWRFTCRFGRFRRGQTAKS